MTLTVAVQMDPVETIAVDRDSTFALALEAQRRGYSLFHYLPGDMALENGVLTAWARPWSVQRVEGDHSQLGEPILVNLASLDVILMRQDPPFDLAYITATHMLDHIHPKTLVVNNPTSVRNAPEKLLVTHFPELSPPTLITRDRRQIVDFRARHRDIIVKPLFGNGGAGVFHIGPDDENLNSLLEMFLQTSRDPLIIQLYLPEVRSGDKRIILVDGKPAGAVNRVPAQGEARSNLHVGGTALKSSLTRREYEICDIIGPTLREQGLIFVGIDIIGDYLTEINVTSPTGIQEIDRFDGVSIEAQIWDSIEQKL